MIPTKTNDLIKFALKLLSVRDYFSCELIKRLEKKDADSCAIEEVLKYLNKYKYLNDKETLKKYVEEIFEKQRGINYLRKKLYDKGCGELVSKTDLTKIYSGEMEKTAARKLAKSMNSYSVEKIVNRMQSRGFSSEVIYEIFEELKKHEP